MVRASRTAPRARGSASGLVSVSDVENLWRWLVGGSVVESLLIGAFFTLPFSHLWGTIPNNATATGAGDAEAGASVGTAIAVAVVFGLPTLLPFVFVARRRVWVACASGAALAGMLVLLLVPDIMALVTWPCCADDALDYVNRQRLWTVYGGNPFSVVPNDYPQDWSYAFAQFRDSGFGYGPLWWIATRAFTFSATSLDGYLIGLKLLAAVCFGTALLLIWVLSPRSERLANALFFAWNPVVMVDGILRLHNDLLTVPLVLAAVYIARSRSGWSLLPVALASLIKLTAAPLGLVLLADLTRARRWRSVAVGLGSSLVAAAVLYAPFWFGPTTLLPLVTQANRAQWSIGAVFQAVAQLAAGPPAVPIARGLTLVLSLALFALLVRGYWRAREAGAAHRVEVLATWGGLSLLVGVLTMPLAVYGHYLMPALGLAAVSRDARLRALLVIVSAAAMINTVLGIAQFAGGPRGEVLDQLGTVVLLGGVALGLVAASGGFRRRFVGSPS